MPSCSDSSSATGQRSGMLASLAMAFSNASYQRAAASGDSSAIQRNVSIASALALAVTTTLVAHRPCFSARIFRISASMSSTGLTLPARMSAMEAWRASIRSARSAISMSF